MPALKKKTKNGSSHKGKDKIAEYYNALDLMSWWEAFNGDCLENGQLKYKTVWSFVSAKTKVDWQRKFLYWILGPVGQSDEYKKYQQFDWISRRDKGHWYSSENATHLEKDLRNKQNALDAMKEVGYVNITFINRLEALAKEIDREYSGRLFLSNLSAKENSIRAASYTSLLDKLLKMMTDAQLMYGKTMGMDLDRLNDFFAMFAKGMGSAVTEHMGFAGSNTIEGNVNAPNSTATLIAQMIMAKAAEREIDLPDKEMEGVVLDSVRPKLVVRK